MSAWLQKLQQLEAQQLAAFADICERHNLRYYLVGGTLLGAVRHKGFIPWDDDIDVAMPRSDYNRFLDLAPRELPPEFELEIPSRIPKDPYYLTRLRRTNTVYESAYIRQFELPCTGVWIDVFPLDDQPRQDSLHQRLDGYLIERHLNRIIRNYHNTGPISAGGGAYLWLARRLPFEFYRRARDKIARRHEGKNLPYWLTYAGVFGYRKETFAKSVFEPPERLTFEGRLYTVPGDYQQWLTRMYGDYMRLPPAEKQVPHKAVRFTVDGVNQL
jgi:lipopolysaccharide cholinephosphotransferase